MIIIIIIYVALLFDLTDFFNFIDDNFTLAIAKDKHHTIQITTNKLYIITKWLKDSGLSVSKSKTEFCVFHHKHMPTIELVLNNVSVKSKMR